MRRSRASHGNEEGQQRDDRESIENDHRHHQQLSQSYLPRRYMYLVVPVVVILAFFTLGLNLPIFPAFAPSSSTSSAHQADLSIASPFGRRNQNQRSKTMTGQQQTPHVVVIGGGLAGLTAATTAVLHGSKVTLVDKNKLGGNSARATSGINGVCTKAQKAAGIEDSIDAFIEDTLASGQGLTDPRLARVLSAQSASAIDFLVERGVDLSSVEILGGHSHPRTHRIPPKDGKPVPVGFTVVGSLKSFLTSEKKDKVEILEGTRVVDVEFLETLESVKAVKIQKGDEPPITLEADAFVFASGGYSADRAEDSLLKRFAGGRGVESMATTNGEFTTGDMVKIGLTHNLTTIHLDQIQLHPTSFVNPDDPFKQEKMLCPEVVRGVGGILLTREGRRFVNELGRRDEVSQAVLKVGSRASEWKLKGAMESQENLGGALDGKIAALLMNEKVKQRVGVGAFAFYTSKNLIKATGDLASTAKFLGVEEATLRETLEAYAKAKSGDEVDLYGKSVFPEEFSPSEEFYVAFITPAVHYTMGGLAITPGGQLLSRLRGGRPILNLYAAGEVSGGLHGANRLGGNGMLESVVFGRLAGRRAAGVLQSNQLSSDRWLSLEVRQFEDGKGGLRYVSFNLPSSTTAVEGIRVGQKVAFRCPKSRGCPKIDDAEKVEGELYISSLPGAFGDRGLLELTLPPKGEGGGKVTDAIWLMQPGDVCEIRRIGEEVAAGAKDEELLAGFGTDNTHKKRIIFARSDTNSVGGAFQVQRSIEARIAGGMPVNEEVHLVCHSGCDLPSLPHTKLHKTAKDETVEACLQRLKKNAQAVGHIAFELD